MSKFVIAKADDWQALYVDGQLVVQYHRVTLREFAAAAGLDYTELYDLDDWTDHSGEFPAQLDTLTAWIEANQSE